MTEARRPIKQAVILAAGKREGFDAPVALLEIEDTTIIQRLLNKLRNAGVEQVVIVTGYNSTAFAELAGNGVTLVQSDKYKWTGTMYSLSLAREYIDSDFLLIEGDIIFEERALDYLMAHASPTCLLIANESGSGDESLVEVRDGAVFKISKDIHQLSKIDGEFIGLAKISLDAFDAMLVDFAQSQNPYLHYEYVLLNVRDNHILGFAKVDDIVWAEIDTPAQYNSLKYVTYPKLQRREKEFHEKHIIDVAAQALGAEYAVAGPVEKLGGMNNFNYKLNSSKGAIVVRLPGKGTEESVDRNQESANAQVAYAIGLDCETLHFDSQTGLKVTRYIDEAETLTIASAKREANMELMAQALNLLHSSTTLFTRTFDPFENIAEFEQSVFTQDGLIFDDYYAVKSDLTTLRQILEEAGLEYVPCHLDAWPENFVKGIDKIHLIDWEYSGNYDRLWDVVSIGLECEYTRDEEDLFLSKYFPQGPSPDDTVKMDILRIVMDIHWSMWALAKVSSGDVDLYDYSLGRYERGKGNLAKFRSTHGIPTVAREETIA